MYPVCVLHVCGGVGGLVSTALLLHISAGLLYSELDDIDSVLLSRYGVPRSRPCELPASMKVDAHNYYGFCPLPGKYARKLHEFFTGHAHFKKNGWITKYAHIYTFLLRSDSQPNCAAPFPRVCPPSYYLVTHQDLTGCTTQEMRLVCAPSQAAPPGSASMFTLHLGEIKVFAL